MCRPQGSPLWRLSQPVGSTMHMCDHMAGLGTFPDAGITHVGGIGCSGERAKSSPERGSLVHPKRIGMLIAAAFPLSPAIAQQTQPATDQSAQAAAPVAPSPP